MITAVKYHVRRIAALLILFLLVRAGFKALLHDEPSDPPVPAQETSVSAEPRRQAAASIAQGRPVEMVVPVLGLRAGFEQADCRVVDGKIDPKSMDKACALTGEGYPYELPGTDAGDIVVVAGHTGAGVDAVFNKLYDGKAERHTVATGDHFLHPAGEPAGGQCAQRRGGVAAGWHGDRRRGRNGLRAAVVEFSTSFLRVLTCSFSVFAQKV